MVPVGLPRSRAEVLDEVASTLLGRASRVTRLLLRSGPRDMTRTEIGVLSSLAERSCRVTDLAEIEAVAQPTMTKVVDRLEARGLVARQRDPDDGRVVLVSISPEGEQRLEAARSHVRSLLRRHLLDLDDDDLAALVLAGEVLEQVIGALQRGDVGA
jgi:DNA-binding MarR family transcriptional regulator